MKEELQNQLITILPDLKSAMQQGIAYGGDLFNRAITYFILERIVFIIISLIAIIVSIIIARKIYTYYKKEKEDECFYLSNYPEITIPLIVLFGAFLVAIINICWYTIDLIKLNIIPEIFIIELLTK